MKHPVIGITCAWITDQGEISLRLDGAYLRVVESVGGVGMLLPPQQEIEPLLKRIDGLLIPGGPDIDPQEYGEPPHEKTQLIARARYDFEKTLLQKAEVARKPVLGICYGCQLLNVVRGGSLHQHLPDLPGTLSHQREEVEEEWFHPVRLEQTSRLYQWIGLEQFEVPTSHHQGIKTLGNRLRIAALAPDGVIEAIEDPDLPFYVGLQWHPERDPESVASRRLFEAFVQACGH